MPPPKNDTPISVAAYKRHCFRPRGSRRVNRCSIVLCRSGLQQHGYLSYRWVTGGSIARVRQVRHDRNGFTRVTGSVNNWAYNQYHPRRPTSRRPLVSGAGHSRPCRRPRSERSNRLRRHRSRPRRRRLHPSRRRQSHRHKRRRLHRPSEHQRSLLQRHRLLERRQRSLLRPRRLHSRSNLVRCSDFLSPRYWRRRSIALPRSLINTLYGI